MCEAITIQATEQDQCYWIINKINMTTQSVIHQKALWTQLKDLNINELHQWTIFNAPEFSQFFDELPISFEI